MKRTKTWWHIVSNDGSYMSRARFGTKESAEQEMLENSKTYDRKTHKAVEVTYTWEDEQC